MHFGITGNIRTYHPVKSCAIEPFYPSSIIKWGFVADGVISLSKTVLNI